MIVRGRVRIFQSICILSNKLNIKLFNELLVEFSALNSGESAILPKSVFEMPPLYSSQGSNNTSGPMLPLVAVNKYWLIGLVKDDPQDFGHLFVFNAQGVSVR